MRMKIGAGPGCCCDTPCCVFVADFSDQDIVDADWTTPENLTVDTMAETADLATTTTVGPVASLPSGSGYLSVSFVFPPSPDKFIIRAAYKDANNHWRAEFWVDDYPGTTAGDSLFVALYEVVGGVDTYCGTRWHLIGVNTAATAEFCWYEGQVMTLECYEMTFDFPMHVTDGMSFELEAGDSDVTITDATLCKNDQVQEGCPCFPETCIQCVDELNDTWQLEVMSGPDTGAIYVADRYLDWPFYLPAFGNIQNFDVSYWFWSLPDNNGGADYAFSISLCVDSLGDTSARLRIDYNPNDPFVGSKFADFTMSDCVGPFDVTVDGHDYQITPL